TVLPGGQLGSTGSECRQGQRALPQVRPHRSHAVTIHQSPFKDLTAATGFWKILLPLVWLLKSGAPFSRTQICVRRALRVSRVPLRSHNSISICSADELIEAPK